jgi:alkylation response protein AidB-like acyl-CoA dehydrogenase
MEASGQYERGAPAPVPAAAAVVDAARSLGASIRERSAEIEAQRRLPRDVVDALADAGCFRLCVPRVLGGVEADVASLIETIESIAIADGSAGWCVMIGATSGVLSAYLTEEAARPIYAASARDIAGGVFAPLGSAVPVTGGYTVSGRWPFASGCEHCTWLMGGCVVVADGSTLPDSRLMIFPASAATVIDTWNVSGLRGSGSHDIAVHDLFVPAEHAVSLITDRPRHHGELYRFPVFGLLALGIAGVALGIARRAIDELVDLAANKTPSGSRKRLAERALIQTQVAQAEVTLRAARALVFDTVRQVTHGAEASGSIAAPQRAALRLAATHATTASAQAVDLMYNAGGGTSIYADSALQRCFRDIHVATQHMMVGPSTYELAGRVLLGLETDISQL